MKVTVTYTELDRNERERLVSKITGKMLEIVSNRNSKEESDSKKLEKKGDCEW